VLECLELKELELELELEPRARILLEHSDCPRRRQSRYSK
jgi:hypothetical protein